MKRNNAYVFEKTQKFFKRSTSIIAQSWQLLNRLSIIGLIILTALNVVNIQCGYVFIV